MGTTARGFRLRRTVPYRRRVAGQRLTIAINDLGPAAAVVSVTATDGSGTRQRLVVGDVLEVGGEHWRLAALVPGDRGSVDFEPVTT